MILNSALYADIWSDETKSEAKNLPGPIMIIGASGFIGAKLFFSLLKLRKDVYAASRNSKQSWRLVNIPTENLLQFDITRPEQVREVFSKIKPKTIFNLSAYGAYARQSNTQQIHLTNYMGTLNLIKEAQEVGCMAFVQAGSSSEYGLNCSGPSENATLSPNSDYAVSKIGASYLINYYAQFHDFPGVNARLYSIYGPWEERDRLIPRLIENGLQKKYPVLVNKEISRDFVYIDDCNAALVTLALNGVSALRGQSVNIASGKETTLETVAACAKELFHIAETPAFGSMPNRKWDLTRWYGDPTLIQTTLKWKAQVDFKRGLALTLEWEKFAKENISTFIPAKKEIKISAIFACYRDNQSIPLLYERSKKVFEELGTDYEIIFVNDCSPANDEEVIFHLTQKDSRVIGISHSRNFGSQAAFLSGMDISTGDAVVLMDGDGQDPPEVIKEFYQQWQAGHDVVYGQRVKRQAPFYMQILYKIFYRLFQRLAEIKIPLDAGDFSLIDRKVVTHLTAFKESDVFLRGLRAWVGFKQIGVPYHRPERLFGTSTNSFFKNIWWAKKAIFSFSTKPIHYIQAMGVGLFLLSIILFTFYLLMHLFAPDTAPRGFTTIILLVIGMGAAQIIAISIIGDYIGKIIEDVKARKKFIREKLYYNGIMYKTDHDITLAQNNLRELKNL